MRVDGSSTIGPFAIHAAGAFGRAYPNVRITVAVSGTGGGFRRFCSGETDISNASRSISTAEEQACRAGGVEYQAFPVANDAITLITSRRNHWLDCLTTHQLNRIWRPGSRVRRWNEVDPRFPAERLLPFGPDTDSGTFDYFTRKINRRIGASRSDYVSNANDNVTVDRVAKSIGGLGYLGFTYYEANRDRLKVVAVDSGGGCVEPGVKTVRNGTYEPLSRPLFVYANTKSLERPAVREFVRFMLADADAPLLAVLARLIPLTERQTAQAQRAFQQAVS